MRFILFVVSLLLQYAPIFGRSVDEYACSFCTASADRAKENGQSLYQACLMQFPYEICLPFIHHDQMKVNANVDSRSICEKNLFCSSLSEETWRSKPTASSSLDIRVSKAYGSRGYNNIRLSVISNESISSEYFSYSQQFQYRWTNNFLNTGIVSVKPGEKTAFTIAGQSFDVYIPKQGEGVRGVIIGDPCFTSENIVCLYSKPFAMFDHLTGLLNEINAHDDVHYWSILGDNFYDQNGEPTAKFFSALTTATKTKVYSTVPGNHDFWINASPKLYVKKDQLGNGFMQWNGQDVAASVVDPSKPYDFSVNPDVNQNAYNIPPGSNYFYYHQLGNVAFIGYSGAHKYEEMQGQFEEACSWAQSTNPDVILLVGHWNSDGDGCESDMTVPAIYSSITSLPACQPVASKIKYVEGHKHCNMIVEPDVGFMVGGIGMSDYQCGGELGIPVFDTTGGSFKIYYFPITKFNEFDNYDETINCIKQHGISGCYHLATLWVNTPF